MCVCVCVLRTGPRPYPRIVAVTSNSLHLEVLTEFRGNDYAQRNTLEVLYFLSQPGNPGAVILLESRREETYIYVCIYTCISRESMINAAA